MMTARQIRIKKLSQKAQNRGTRETCELIGSFAASCLEGFDDPKLDAFEALLEISDPEIMDSLMGLCAPPSSLSELFDEIALWVDVEYAARRQRP